MGLLDDLRREADRVRDEREAEERRLAELDQIYHAGISPRLLDIHRYLTELVEHLRTVNWTVEASFPIPGIGKIEGLRQGNYRVHIDSHKAPKKVRLQCICLASEEQDFSADIQKADQLRQFLTAHQAFFTEWPKRDESGKVSSVMFRVKLRVRAELLFEPDIQTSRILVTSYNFEDIAYKEYGFGYTSIDEKWLDGLGNYVLRKKLVLGSQEMSDEARERLRQRLEQEKSHKLRQSETPANPTSGSLEKTAGSGILENLRNRLFKSDKGG